MANIKITDLVTLTEPVSTDVLPIVDVSLDVTKKISIAQLLRTAGKGSQTAPGISFDGDTNTGVYSPGANQLAFTTNGSEALRIAADGKIGIGITGPEANLSIVGTNTTGGIKIVDSSTSASSPGIEVIAKRGDANNSTSFSAKLLLSRNRTEAAIVEDNQLGSVSFGGNHTDGTEANILYSAALIGVADGDFNGASDMPTALAFYTGSIGWSPDTANANPGSEALRITSGGLVGIGTTAPDELLHIRGDVAEFKGTNTNAIDATSGTEQIFKFGIEGQKNNVYGPAGSIIFRQDGSSWSSAESNFKPTRIELCTQDGTATDTSETPRLVVDQSGLVGIGLADPLSLLHVKSPLFNTAETVASFGNSSISDGLEIITNGNLDWGFNAKNSRNLTFRTNQTERLRITSGGLVGIGLTNPGEKLEVNGTIKATDINFTGLATYADDAAAGAGGLVTGDVYKTSTGELRIKL